jgi:hypothetical protein
MTEPGVDRDGFESRMREIDAKLGRRNVPALWRPIFAWSQMSGQRIFRSEPPDPNCSPFEGPNLYHEIEGWYGRHYQSIRYERARMETAAVLNRMDYSYAICAAVAKSLLRARRKPNAA